MRMYHPDYRPSWFERLGELFRVDRPDREPEGVDPTLLRRAAVRDVQAFVEGKFDIRDVGWGLVRIDSNARLPDDPAARRVTCGNIVRRVRLVEVGPKRCELPTRTIIPAPARWYQFEDAGGGTSVVIRLVHPVSHPWSWHLSVDLSTGRETTWKILGVEGESLDERPPRR